jgi:hypothetical protein
VLPFSFHHSFFGIFIQNTILANFTLGVIHAFWHRNNISRVVQFCFENWEIKFNVLIF